MREVKIIKKDIEALKYEIRLATVEGNEQEVELLWQDLDDLLEELHNAQSA